MNEKIDILKPQALFYRYMLPRQSICCLCEKDLYRFYLISLVVIREPALLLFLMWSAVILGSLSVHGVKRMTEKGICISTCSQ